MSDPTAPTDTGISSDRIAYLEAEPSEQPESIYGTPENLAQGRVLYRDLRWRIGAWASTTADFSLSEQLRQLLAETAPTPNELLSNPDLVIGAEPSVFAPHPLGATLGPAGVRERRGAPLLAGEIIRLLEERHGVPWPEAVREAAGLMAQSIEEAEGWWAFEMADVDSLTDAEMIAAKRASLPPAEPTEIGKLLDDLQEIAPLFRVDPRQYDKKYHAARTAITGYVSTRMPQNEAERELLEKYRGFASTGQAMATTNAGVLLTTAEYNRLHAEVSRLTGYISKIEGELRLAKGANEILHAEWEHQNAEVARLREATLTDKEKEWLTQALLSHPDSKYAPGNFWQQPLTAKLRFMSGIGAARAVV